MKSLLQSIGDYQILEKLGRGGMADVYLALDRGNNRRIALKLVERGDGQDAQEIMAAERLGAELQQSISRMDPRVPRIYTFGDLDGYFFIEMEFVEGNDLSVLIGTGLRPEEAAVIASELCSILRTTHGMSLEVGGRELRGIVHGDIKPRNIRIDTDGKVRVLDFGIAKGLSITRRLTNNVFGSAAYSSPERLDTGSMDERSDLWAVGVVLYEMVAGTLPHEAPSTERMEAAIKARNAIRPLPDTCPMPLQQIIYKALARYPERRYESAAQFEGDLRAFLSGQPTIASQECEETRRTVPLDAEETRRTTPSREPESVLPAGEPASPVRRTNPFSKYRKWVLAGCFAFFALIGIWEAAVGRTAAQLKPDLLAGRLDADAAWSRYQEVRSRSPLGIAPLFLRSPLQDLLRQNCERIINQYRSSDTSRIREGDWIRCKRYVSRAIQLDARDKRSAAILEYANGHILRINRKNLDAISAFQQAAALQPKWPDPYLGMARTYIYNMGDMDRGTQALDSAQELGYRFAKREMAMMAEAHKSRGVKALENADVVRGTDQEEEFLRKAKKEFDEALDIYLEISPWGNSATQILSIQDMLAEVDQRMNELNPPNPILPWNWFK